MLSNVKSSGNSGHCGLLLGDLGRPDVFGGVSCPDVFGDAGQYDPVMDPMVALSWCSSCELEQWVGTVQQFAVTGLVAVWSEADGSPYYRIAARIQ